MNPLLYTTEKTITSSWRGTIRFLTRILKIWFFQIFFTLLAFKNSVAESVFLQSVHWKAASPVGDGKSDLTIWAESHLGHFNSTSFSLKNLEHSLQKNISPLHNNILCEGASQKGQKFTSLILHHMHIFLLPYKFCSYSSILPNLPDDH